MTASLAATKALPPAEASAVLAYTFDGHRRWYIARLARENGWTFDHARRVLDEYLRFAWLTRVAGHVVVPSAAVDEAWHLHIIDTEVYAAFCQQVLGGPLHHRPGRGTADLAEHQALYRRTLASYATHFGTPPADIWPPPQRRFAPARRQNVALADAWVLPKPPLRNAVRVAAVLLLAAGVGGAAPAAASLGFAGPLDLDGPAFLVLFFALLGIATAFGIAARRLWRPPGDAPPRQLKLSPFELAYLAGGPAAAVDTAVAYLDADGSLHTNPKTGWRLYARRQPGQEADSFLHAVWEAVGISSRGRSVPEVRRRAAFAANMLAERLTDLGLLIRGGQALAVRLAAATLPVAVTALGGMKIFVGVTRDKPAAFLVIGCALAAGLALWLGRRLAPPRSRRGDALLQNYRRELKPLRRSLRDDTSHDATDFALALAAFGPGVLAGTMLADLNHAYRQKDPSSFSLTSSGGDASSCGTSSCGGGCGGCGGD